MTRRTQAERRTATRQAVLDSALRLFGEQGYQDTSLAEIASDCDLTIRPIYHYFGNKEALFEAVFEVMEERIIQGMGREYGNRDPWSQFLTLCDDATFRQVMLVDAPVVLGRDRWLNGRVTETVESRLGDTPGSEDTGLAALRTRAALAAIAEVALSIAEVAPEKLPDAKADARRVLEELGGLLR